MIGCLYPTHAQTALQALHAALLDLVKRIRGLKADASPLPPERLDKLNRLAASDVQTWVRDEVACACEFGLTIFGGCCGTNRRYIEALAKEVQFQHSHVLGRAHRLGPRAGQSLRAAAAQGGS
jgi:S-methylmethionine-dependent homocysteine/selenocysteine methylase